MQLCLCIPWTQIVKNDYFTHFYLISLIDFSLGDCCCSFNADCNFSSMYNLITVRVILHDLCMILVKHKCDLCMHGSTFLFILSFVSLFTLLATYIAVATVS